MIIDRCHLLIWKYDWFLYFASFAKKCKTHDGTCKSVENFYMHISRFCLAGERGGGDNLVVKGVGLAPICL